MCIVQVFGCSGKTTAPDIKSQVSTQDYMFAEYLTSPIPDVIILCTSLHNINPLNNTTFIEHQLQLLDRFVLTKTTRVILVPLHSVNLSAMPREWREKLYYDEGGMLVNRAEWVRQFNVILYRLAKKRFSTRANLLQLPNLVDVSSSILSYNIDGVHMNDAWYISIMSAILQLLCGI